MKDIKKYQGVIPAFYACYDAEGNISTEGVKALTRHLIAKGVKGVYVGGSSGECIYQHVDERKAVLEAVMSEAKGKITVIAHVACNNTRDSQKLAAHAGAGSLVPITGFANAVVSAAIEFKTEGRVLGTGAKMFTIAGPVIVYGTLAAVVYGVFLWLTGGAA